MKRFALIGIAGYIAPRHLQAIKDIGGILVAAYDIHDAVGVLDKYFPECKYFNEMERFDRYINALSLQEPIDYLVVCSPNYLHDAHIRFGIKNNMHVICEKPIVLNVHNLYPLIQLSASAEKKVYPLLQLRYHPAIIQLKNNMDRERAYKVKLIYVTPRGSWYNYSWKGDFSKSGGILMNIGVHFFDLLLWLFGQVKSYEIHHNEDTRKSGVLVLENATVDWFLSINKEDKASFDKPTDMMPYKSLLIDDIAVDLDSNFENLHTVAYNHIVSDNAITLEDCLPHISLINLLQNSIS